MIRVGQVAGAYGLDGAVKVIPLTDFDDRFNPGANVMLEGATREIEWSRPGHPGLETSRQDPDDRAGSTPPPAQRLQAALSHQS